MSSAHKKRAKLKRQHEAVNSWPDIFDRDDITRALECHLGDRVVTAHIRQFEEATEKMVLKVWGVHASTTEIVKNWDNFILGQLLDATRMPGRSDGHGTATNTYADGNDGTDLCETCLRRSADLFAKNIRVSRISSESVSSTPTPSRAGTPQPSGCTTSNVVANPVRRLSRPLRIWALDTLDLRIYVTSSYVHLLRSSPASICTDTPSTYTSLYLNFRPSEASFYPPCSNPDQHLSVYTLLLASDSQNLLSTDNAGGSSLESEVLSFEVLKRIMPYWELSTMEMSTKYASPGPITDYVARSHISPTQEISVSVTRIFGWSASMRISKSALTPLLIRKLTGLRSATSRILPRRRRGMVLFIWVPDGAVEKNVRRVWKKLEADDDDDDDDDDEAMHVARAAAQTSKAQDGGPGPKSNPSPTRSKSSGRSSGGNHGSDTRTAYGVAYERGITRNVIVFVGVCRKESWMDPSGWRRVFGKVDVLENEYLYALTGDEKYIAPRTTTTTTTTTTTVCKKTPGRLARDASAMNS